MSQLVYILNRCNRHLVISQLKTTYKHLNEITTHFTFNTLNEKRDLKNGIFYMKDALLYITCWDRTLNNNSNNKLY